MADIKTRESLRSPTKTKDSMKMMSLNAKNTYIKTRERARSANESDGSLSDYPAREYEDAARTVVDKGSYFIDREGRKQFNKTTERIGEVKSKNLMIKKFKDDRFGNASNNTFYIEESNAFPPHNSKTINYPKLDMYEQHTKGVRAKKLSRMTHNNIKTRATNNTVKRNVIRIENTVLKQKAYKLAKRNAVNNQVSKELAIKSANTGKNGIKKTANVFTRSAKFAYESIKALISAIMAAGWIALVAVIICCLFGAAIYFFGDSTGSFEKVSPEVEAYTSVITKYAKDYEIPDYVELIKAVMMQESSGKGKDPMQSSKCKYNTKYPGGITDPEYSIKCGVAFLSELLKKADCEFPIDLEHIRLALQSYNYGEKYLNWAVKKDGGYTVSNADEYSTMQAEKLGLKSYGDKLYVSHVLRYYPYGNYNYGVGNGVIVKVAEEQIGNAGGKPYWEWYGFNSHVEWCACFVSWCADQCGYIDAGIIPKYAVVGDGINWFKERRQFQNRKYEPQPGDIIFFDWENDGIADHTGIVKKCENGVVTTIEGNSNDRCKEKTYLAGSTFIKGYGVPKY